MAERTIIVLAASAALLAVLIAVDVLLSVWFDVGMRRKKPLRARPAARRGTGPARRPQRAGPTRRYEPWGER